MPIDTMSVPMLNANASVVTADSENAALATTRKAAASPMASHQRYRLVVLLWMVVVLLISREARAGEVRRLI
jgi:hypothetical protein